MVGNSLYAAAENNSLDEIIGRIVEVAHPEKISPFGSSATGTEGKDSDLDLLVVKTGVHRRRLAQNICLNLIGVGRAVDVFVVTPEDLDCFGDSPALIIESALREGKVIYAA